MCGLTGFFDINLKYKGSEMQSIAKAMGRALAHRGPDSTDIWQDPDHPLILSHRRLSIIDLSDEGRQPMASPSGRYVIAYNGEIYNFIEIADELAGHGLQMKGRSDTEALLLAIEHWGLNLALQKINGMFAFALWDRKERQLHFVRDRLGKKPLYVGWAGTSFIFGSELKALCQHPEFEREVNRESLALYLQFGYLPAPASIYKNVWVLPAGHRMAICDDLFIPESDLSRLMEPYWHHGKVIEDARLKPETLSDNEHVKAFDTLLSKCVKDRMVSDVPLGAFLSGGIDSSSIVAMMQQHSPRAVKTYTIGFHEAGFDEAAYAKQIANHLNTDHHELYLNGQDALDIIPLLAEMYDEPFADMSAIPTYLVSQFAQQEVTVVLSGDGGDEMLGGYNRHFEGPKLWNKMSMLPGFARKGIAGIMGAIPVGIWDKIRPGRPQFGSGVHKAASILSLDSQDDIYKRLLSKWESPPVAGIFKADLFMDGANWSIDPHKPLSFAEQMMYRDALSYLPNDILTKVDRATMAVSLEARAPLLDRRIYEYVWRLPEHVKIRGGQGKWLLREVLKTYVPSDLFERPKQGFNIPIGEWLRGPLKDWAEDLLDEQRLQKEGYLNPHPIRKAWDAHLAGHGNYGDQLWTILMFQSWQEHWLS